MFKRLLNIFKRDEAKKQAPQKVSIEMPKPKEVKTGSRWGWINLLVQRSRSFKLQKQINRGLHIANPKHCIKPMRPLKGRTDLSYSASVHIDRLKGVLPTRKQERKELGILNPSK